MSKKIIEFQKMLSNSNWVDFEDDDLSWVLERNGIENENALITALNAGDIYYDSEWYAVIRIKPNEEEERERVLEAQRKALKYQKQEEKRFYREVEKYECW